MQPFLFDDVVTRFNSNVALEFLMGSGMTLGMRSEYSLLRNLLSLLLTIAADFLF